MGIIFSNMTRVSLRCSVRAISVSTGTGDRVDADAVAGEIDGECLGEGDDPALGGTVGAGTPRGTCGGGHDCDHGTAALPRDHRPRDREAGVIRAHEIDVDDPL